MNRYEAPASSTATPSLGRANALYFAAGPRDETEGLFGRLETAPIPEPETWAPFAAGLVLLGSVT